MKEKTEKRTRFGVANLVWALVSFGIFMAVGLTGHYMAVGEFVTAELAQIAWRIRYDREEGGGICKGST